SVNLDNCKIHSGIGCDDLTTKTLPIGKTDLNLFRVVNHVMGGQDVSLGTNDESGSPCFGRLNPNLNQSLPYLFCQSYQGSVQTFEIRISIARVTLKPYRKTLRSNRLRH